MEEGETDIPRKKPAKCSKRCNIITLIFLVNIFLYLTKYLFSVAVGQLIPMENRTAKDDPYAVCNSTNDTYFYNRPGLYGWSRKIFEDIFKGYYWGFLATSLAAGVYVDKIGGRIFGLIMILVTTFLLLLYPTAIKYCRGIWKILLTWNVALGMAQGTVFVTCTHLLGQWILPEERTTIIALNNAALKIGNLVSLLFGNFLTKISRNWTTRFYVFGSFGLFCALLWYCWCYSSPERHPKITEKELLYLRGKLGANYLFLGLEMPSIIYCSGPYVQFKKKTIPWRKMLSSVPVWGLMISNLGSEWAIYLTSYETTSFLIYTVQIHLDSNMYVMTMVPVVVMSSIDIICSISWDYLIKKEKLDISTARKIYANLGGMGVAIFTVAIAYTSCYHEVTIAIFNIILVFFAMYSTGMKVNVLDLTSNFAGTLGGVTTTFGTASVIVMDNFITEIIKDHYVLHWRKAFWISLALVTCTTLIFSLTCRGEERTWNVPPELRRKDKSDEVILEEHDSDIE